MGGRVISSHTFTCMRQLGLVTRWWIKGGGGGWRIFQGPRVLPLPPHLVSSNISLGSCKSPNCSCMRAVVNGLIALEIGALDLLLDVQKFACKLAHLYLNIGFIWRTKNGHHVILPQSLFPSRDPVSLSRLMFSLRALLNPTKLYNATMHGSTL